MDRPLDDVRAADRSGQPSGYVVAAEAGDRIHFLDWAGRQGPLAGVLLVHGLSQTAWIWAPVARRLAAATRVVSMDLRGHGLSDAPTEDGAYALDVLAGDVVASAEGSGLLTAAEDRVVVAGHGFGAIVAVAAALELGDRCGGLALVDGGWESLPASTGLDVDEFLRGVDEPPEVMRSMADFLADRAGFDKASWDVDQERAARATVVETHAGRLVPATRPHALDACVRTMFGYDPAMLAGVDAPIVALSSADDGEGARSRALANVAGARIAAGQEPIELVSFPYDGHNLMRYRPAEVTAAILDLCRRAAPPAAP